MSVAIDAAGAGRTKGLPDVQQLVHASLIIVDGTGTFRPRLAEEIPSLENGRWRVLPDGRMETTWRIRPDARWHDGTPFTAADLLFTAQVARDPEIAIIRDPAFEFVEAVEAPEPHTLVVRWKRPFIEADTLFAHAESQYVMPLPRHLLEAPYLEDKGSFLLLPYWTEGFVGAGPFRLREWVLGSHLVLDANDHYLLGRPKIDVIEVRFIGDANVTLANILAGETDLTLDAGLSFEQGQDVRQRWQGGTVAGTITALTTLFPQFMNPTPSVITDVRFRRALTHAMDRDQLAATLQVGAPVGHSAISPADPQYRAVEHNIVAYDYDPRKAVQLFDEIGLVRGPDGLFRDSTQQRMSVKIQTTTDDLREKLILIIGDYWQQVGVATGPVVIPRQAASDRQLRATFAAFDSTQSPSHPSRFHSAGVPLPENGFRGNNRSRYSNAQLDTLIDTYFVTIPISERNDVLARMVHYVTDQLVTIGIFYLVEPIFISHRLGNVTAITGGASVVSWNAHEWELR
jgi:peptide/nickel transport system substrate-binding protein